MQILLVEDNERLTEYTRRRFADERISLEIAKTVAAGLRAAANGNHDAGIADIDRLIHTFESLLRLAQIESGARRSGFASMDLITVVRSVVDLYESAAEDKHLQFNVELPSQLCMHGDPSLMAQAINNWSTTRSNTLNQVAASRWLLQLSLITQCASPSATAAQASASSSLPR